MATKQRKQTSGTQGSDSGIVIDRSRLTHRDTKRATVGLMRLRRANEETSSPDEIEALMDEMDTIASHAVSGLPDGWLPEGVTLEQADWLDYVSEERYQAIVSAIRGSVPSEAKTEA